MAKSKDRSETEYLRGIIKNLKSENRNLKKQLSRSNKRAHQYEDFETKLQDTEVEEVFESVIPPEKTCPKCKSKLKESPLGIKVLITCTSCNFKETRKS